MARGGRTTKGSSTTFLKQGKRGSTNKTAVKSGSSSVTVASSGGSAGVGKKKGS